MKKLLLLILLLSSSSYAETYKFPLQINNNTDYTISITDADISQYPYSEKLQNVTIEPKSYIIIEVNEYLDPSKNNIAWVVINSIQTLKKNEQSVTTENYYFYRKSSRCEGAVGNAIVFSNDSNNIGIICGDVSKSLTSEEISSINSN